MKLQRSKTETNPIISFLQIDVAKKNPELENETGKLEHMKATERINKNPKDRNKTDPGKAKTSLQNINKES
ncbi:unnamed protein product [Dovyalis caffra]|uniref:Thymosin beta n=1 Tax=Dovyalis caffra TaxID=77055 RepID=A0AAV1RU38_9ROSI|nr:unnamed protein product [Dovyalis caffra]